MKIFFFLFYCVIFSISMQSQTVSVDSLAYYEGQKVTVCAKVEGVFISQKAKKTIFINFEKPFPNQKFVVVIFEKDLVNFSYDPDVFLKEKSLCITGIIKMYNGKPEIIATKEEQIVIQ
jgi:hypothetical protein